MLKALLKDLLTYGTGALLVRAISLILLPVYARVFSPEQFGIIDLLTIAASLVAITIPLEITQAVPRFYADASAQEEKRLVASTALWFTVGTYILFLFVSLVNSRVFCALLLGSKNHTDVFKIAAVSMTTGGIFYFLQNQLRWELKSKLYVTSNVTYFLTYAASSIVLIVAFHQGLSGVFGGFVVGGVAAIGLSIFFLRTSLKFTFNLGKCTELLSFSLPFVPSSLSVFIATYIDRLAIRKLMTLSDVGIFGVGYRVASVMGILLACFQAALSPLVFGKYKDPATPKELSRIFSYFLALTLPIVLGLGLYSHEILHALATAKYDKAAPIVSLLALAVTLSSMYVLAPGLFLAKKTKIIAGINVGAALTNTTLNFLLIPRFGIFGSAAATLLNSVLTFSAYIFFNQKYYPIPLNWKKIISALFCMLVFIGLPWCCPNQLLGFSWKLEVLKTLYTLGCIGIFELLLLGPREVATLTHKFAAWGFQTRR